MIDYIKPIVRRKPDVLILHTGTNDLTNNVNTIRKIRIAVKCIRDIDKGKKIKIGFSSIINRKDRNLDAEINDLNINLKIIVMVRNSFLLITVILISLA